MSVSDPYKVLQVDPEAEDEVIEAAYRRLARKYHPDVSPDPESHARMIAINKAWEQLRDPVKRAAVDRARQRSSGTAAWVAAADAHARSAAPAATSPTREGQPRPAPGSATPKPGDAETSWPFGMHDPSAPAPAAASQEPAPSPPRSWATGRVPIGGFGSGAASRPDGAGAAGPPPGHPSGSVLNFGRYAGWSLGEIARFEVDYLEWLGRMPIGRTYQSEIDELLRSHGRRTGGATAQDGGPFRRR